MSKELPAWAKDKSELWEYWSRVADLTEFPYAFRHTIRAMTGRLMTPEDAQRAEAERVNRVLERALDREDQKNPTYRRSACKVVDDVLRSSEFSPKERNRYSDKFSYPYSALEKVILMTHYPAISNYLDHGEFEHAEALANTALLKAHVFSKYPFRALVADRVDTHVLAEEVGALQNILNTKRILSRAGTPMFVVLAGRAIENATLDSFCTLFAGKVYEELYACPYDELLGQTLQAIEPVYYVSQVLDQQAKRVHRALQNHHQLQSLIENHVSHTVGVQQPYTSHADRLITNYNSFGLISTEFARTLRKKFC